MTNKAYIVANEQQEMAVLRELEEKGLVWTSGREATEWIPSQRGLGIFQFPYSLVDVGYVAWRSIEQLGNYEIIYDGRKESKMSEKYVVSQKFMNELEEWKDTLDSNDYEYKPLVGWVNLKNLPETVNAWCGDEVPDEENNNRLIAILRWVNGEDVFEVEKPKKWVVHELNTKLYVTTYDGHTGITPNRDYITKFDTKEEAESWANAHQEVIEVEA